MGRLKSVVDELAGEDLAGVDDRALADDLVDLWREIDRLKAEWLPRLAALDRRDGWRADGALSAPAWLRATCRLATAFPVFVGEDGELRANPVETTL